MSGEMTQQMLGDFAPAYDTSLSQFHTPAWLCERMVSLLVIKDEPHIIEPSAGGGNIVKACLDVGGRVLANELDPAWCRHIANRFQDSIRILINTGDFLTTDFQGVRRFDAGVMNPPLNAGEGPYHVQHVLEIADQAVTVLRANDMHTKSADEMLWSHCDIAGVYPLVGRDAFAGARSDFVVVDVRPQNTFDGQQIFEHWRF